GKEIPAIEEPRRPGDPARLIAGSQKAIDELGWKPRYATLEQIVDSAWRWHSAHPNGYTG
ncbi:MAG: UDP-glucose 4-epimerase GalE, partial [Verrucomicrobiota bacterium]|nr:UDP-glucose 4-epimerase GalE [Verrucomicrobiota bacterium]